jgi:hypothetical protein
MKIHTLALAAALTFAGAVFAAPSDTATAPVNPAATTAPARHAARHLHRTVRHASVKHHKIVAMKHHHATHMARHHGARETTASASTDVNAGSRDARMEQALQKFRSSHS